MRISEEGLRMRCEALCEWPDGEIHESDPCALDLRDARAHIATLEAERDENATEIMRLQGDVSELRAAALEEAARYMDALAHAEECHDCYDDLARSAPFHKAAKCIRALAAQSEKEST